MKLLQPAFVTARAVFVDIFTQTIGTKFVIQCGSIFHTASPCGKVLIPPCAGTLTASLAEDKAPQAEEQKLAGGKGLLLAVVRLENAWVQT